MDPSNLSADLDNEPMLKSLLKQTPDEILEYLYLGNLTHSKNLDLLKARNIHTIIQISGEKLEPPFQKEFTYH